VLRRYRLKKKNEKGQKDCLNLANIQSDNNEGNSQDCVNKGKNHPIVCEVNDHLNEGSSQKSLPHNEEGNLSVNPQTDGNVNAHEK